MSRSPTSFSTNRSGIWLRWSQSCSLPAVVWNGPSKRSKSTSWLLLPLQRYLRVDLRIMNHWNCPASLVWLLQIIILLMESSSLRSRNFSFYNYIYANHPYLHQCITRIKVSFVRKCRRYSVSSRWVQVFRKVTIRPFLFVGKLGVNHLQLKAK